MYFKYGLILFAFSNISFPGVAKESPIVTPLMEYVRQRRANDSGTQVCWTLLSGKCVNVH